MKSALDVHCALLAQDVPHEMVRLPAVAASADDLPRLLGVDQGACVAVRCLIADLAGGDELLVAVMLRAGDRVDSDAVRDALGALAVRPATADRISQATDFAAGLVSPVGLPPAVTLLADTGLGSHDVLYSATGEGGVALGMRTRDLLVASGASVGSLALRPGRRQGDRAVAPPPAGVLPEPRRSQAVTPR